MEGGGKSARGMVNARVQLSYKCNAQLCSRNPQNLNLMDRLHVIKEGGPSSSSGRPGSVGMKEYDTVVGCADYNFYRYRVCMAFISTLPSFVLSVPRAPFIKDLHEHAVHHPANRKSTHPNAASFLLRLPFLDTFLWIFRLEAASGFVVCWSALAIFLSLCTPSTPCRMLL